MAGAPLALVDYPRAERPGLDQVQRDVTRRLTSSARDGGKTKTVDAANDIREFVTIRRARITPEQAASRPTDQMNMPAIVRDQADPEGGAPWPPQQALH